MLGHVASWGDRDPHAIMRTGRVAEVKRVSPAPVGPEGYPRPNWRVKARPRSAQIRQRMQQNSAGPRTMAQVAKSDLVADAASAQVRDPAR